MASELGDLRNEYKALAGKNPSPRLDADGLRAKIDELKAAAAAGAGAQQGDNGGGDSAGSGATTEPAKPAGKTPKLVKMHRDPEAYPEPHKADVHPDEVTSYAAAGWQQD